MIASLLAATAAVFSGETHMQTQGNASVMDITRQADMTTIDGPAEWFTGRVTISGQFQREVPSRVGGAVVRFEPGARTPGMSTRWARP